jgi:hypothetical protein
MARADGKEEKKNALDGFLVVHNGVSGQGKKREKTSQSGPKVAGKGGSH